MRSPADLAAHLRPMGRVLLGYSGGIDSALLAVVASQALGPDRFLAVLGVSASLGATQHRRAIDLAARHGVPLRELPTDELDDDRYRANPLDRCYHCKRTLWRHVGALADREGWDTIIDGTNADDLGEHRPGARAGHEAAVRTPLAELGWTKADVRRAAQALGIEGWDAPATPCLASRIRPHLEVTAARLAQVEEAEAFLRGLGVTGDLRVRHLDAVARIEVRPEAFGVVDAAWADITATLQRLGFERVERDPRGYRRGALSVLEG
ncbi:MAG: ATP-dependent sacrificial sulfur transferase LarE [Gemmatimonadales bacterium]